MLKVHGWEEANGEWGEVAVEVESDCKDPEAINKAMNVAIDPEYDEYRVVHSAFCGPNILTMETRSTRNHLGIIVVNYEFQEN